MSQNEGMSFSIIKQRGDPDEATTLDKYKVTRKEKVFLPEFGGWVRCAPYSSHFVYLDPTGKKGRWFASCTCGSPAVVVGYDAYRRDQSANEGTMLVCLYHAQHGYHTNEQGSNWE